MKIHSLLYCMASVLTLPALAQHEWHFDFDTPGTPLSGSKNNYVSHWDSTSGINASGGHAGDFTINHAYVNGTTSGFLEWRVLKDEGALNETGDLENWTTVLTAEAGKNFSMTMVPTKTSYDLSKNGSSLRLNQWWSPGSIYNDRGVIGSPSNEAMQIGLLVDGVGTLSGEGGADSFYLNVVETYTDLVHDADFAGHLRGDLRFSNESGQVGSNLATDKPWNPETKAVGDRGWIWYLMDTTYTNDNGKFDIDVTIEQWGNSNRSTPANLNQWELIDGAYGSYSLEDVDLGLSDLTGLTPALGYTLNDVSTISGTGTMYDWSAAPEPSSAFLIIVAGVGCLAGLRRRRLS